MLNLTVTICKHEMRRIFGILSKKSKIGRILKYFMFKNHFSLRMFADFQRCRDLIEVA